MSIRWARSIPFPSVTLFAFVATVLSVSFICYLLKLESHPKFVEVLEFKNLHLPEVRIAFQKQEKVLTKDVSSSSSQHFSPGSILDTYSSALRPKYNLMEEKYGSLWFKSQRDSSLLECTIEYVNNKKLEQDHPCVISLIRQKYLRQPAAKDLPYQLNHPEVSDPSDGQSKAILRILQNKTNGFFVESGGYDGEFLSNSLFMERTLGWSGLLVEADTKAFDKLLTRNRKAYASPVCLSTKPYSMNVMYNATIGTLSSIIERGKQKLMENEPENKNIAGTFTANETENIYSVQCFPLYSILLAIGKTEIDYFGLDVEGSEYKILKTIPWHKVNIKVDYE